MNIITHKQLMSRASEEVPWLVRGLVKAGSIGFIAGEPKTSKSWLALHVAQAVATGSDVLKTFVVPSPAKVLLVQEEDSYNTVIDRLKLLKAGHKTPEPVDGNMLFLIHSGLRVDDAAKLADFRGKLDALREDGKLPDLIIFDVLNKLHNGSDTDQRHATHVMQAFEGIRRDYGCAVLIVHHFGKGSGAKRGNQRLRGSSVFAGWSENSLYLSRVGAKVHVEVENKFAQTDNFDYRIVGAKHAVCLVTSGPEKYALPPIEARIKMTRREREKMLRDWQKSHES